MMKRTTPQGDIRLIENGYGVSTNEFLSPSDQQLYYFEALAEYLRVTGDFGFLQESVDYYPKEGSTTGNSIERIEICFKYLRDIISTGPNGLLHMRYADWNDEAFYLFKNVSYVDFWVSAESHLDSAMAAVVLSNLAKQLDRAAATAPFVQQRARIERLTKSMMQFRNAVQAGKAQQVIGDFGKIERHIFPLCTTQPAQQQTYGGGVHCLDLAEIYFHRAAAFGPQVDIEQAGKSRVRYGNITEEKVPRLIEEHLIKGQVIQEWAIGRLAIEDGAQGRLDPS
jgi:(2Fe-2S) ferredoxin